MCGTFPKFRCIKFVCVCGYRVCPVRHCFIFIYNIYYVFFETPQVQENESPQRKQIIGQETGGGRAIRIVGDPGAPSQRLCSGQFSNPGRYMCI